MLLAVFYLFAGGEDVILNVRYCNRTMTFAEQGGD